MNTVLFERGTYIDFLISVLLSILDKQIQYILKRKIATKIHAYRSICITSINVY